jgi:uncharacterized membrane protein required for colicin V production
MNWLEVALLIFLGLGALAGLRRGLVGVVFDIAGYVAGLLLARRWQGRVTRTVARALPIRQWTHAVLVAPVNRIPTAQSTVDHLAGTILGAVVFLAIVLAAEAVARFLGSAVTALVKHLILVRSLNTVGGLVGGLVRNAVIAGLVLGLVLALPLAHAPLGHAMRGAPLAGDLVRWVVASLHWPVRRWII